MQSQKNPDRPRNRLQPPMSARSSAALGSNPQGDPSWSPLTLRGHATSKVSHTGDDCNDNLRYATDHAQSCRRRCHGKNSTGGAGLVWPTPP
jgi:hypothetical protein